MATDTDRTLDLVIEHAWHHGAQDATYWTRGHRMITHGEGIYVFDADGRRYVDGTSGQAAVQIGHRREEMADAIAEQVRTLAFSPMAFGFSHPLPGILGEKLAELTPGSLAMSWFATSGSEAVETAIKLARQAQILRGQPGRKKIIGRRGSYHGGSYAAVSATATTRLRAPSEPLLPGFRHIGQPYPRTCAFCRDAGGCTLSCADDLERMIEFEGAGTVAAFIAEPVASPETIKIPPPGYWDRIGEVCRRHGVLLIADEVFVGFGRSGRMFGSDHFGIEPDIMTLSKGLSSGYVPISATVATREIAELFDSPAHAFQHVGTYSGHPVGCAAALKNIEIIEREGLVENAARQGERFRERLAPLTELPFVRQLNILGLLVSVELDDAEGLGTPAQYGPAIRDHAYENGLICRFNPNSIFLYPPLIISDEQVDDVCDILIAAFGAVAGGGVR
jgi:adenosylmethionine-8-amino-7-oxononanoate aminotransferase